jgi:ABC-type nitrate/sulfonate/bicarbonate transport system ATPase subunit
MDEPFGALDAQIRAEMQQLLVDVWQKHQCLVVFVTHDISEALLLGDRVIVLSTHPAKVADDFRVPTPRPRAEAWLRSGEATQLHERIIRHLRGDRSSGQVRVTV